MFISRKTGLRALMVAVTAMVTFFAVLPTVPASAAPVCAAGRFCTFADTGGNGAMYYYTYASPNCVNIGPDWNDRISSARNETSHTVHLYQNANCGGIRVDMTGACGGCLGSYINDMGGYFFNDTASSLRFNP